jgi:hypothetical protein
MPQRSIRFPDDLAVLGSGHELGCVCECDVLTFSKACAVHSADEESEMVATVKTARRKALESVSGAAAEPEKAGGNDSQGSSAPSTVAAGSLPLASASTRTPVKRGSPSPSLERFAGPIPKGGKR